MSRRFGDLDTKGRGYEISRPIGRGKGYSFGRELQVILTAIANQDQAVSEGKLQNCYICRYPSVFQYQNELHDRIELLVFCYYMGAVLSIGAENTLLWRCPRSQWIPPLLLFFFTIPVYECLAYLLDRATTVTVNFLVLFISLCFATIKKDCTIFSSQLRFFKG